MAQDWLLRGTDPERLPLPLSAEPRQGAFWGSLAQVYGLVYLPYSSIKKCDEGLPFSLLSLPLFTSRYPTCL